jgi:hypothetical protein
MAASITTRPGRSSLRPSHGLRRLIDGLVQLEQFVDVVLGERVAHPVPGHHGEADIGLPGGLGDDDERGDAVGGDGVDRGQVDQDERRGRGDDVGRNPLQRPSCRIVECICGRSRSAPAEGPSSTLTAGSEATLPSSAPSSITHSIVHAVRPGEHRRSDQRAPRLAIR